MREQSKEKDYTMELTLEQLYFYQSEHFYTFVQRIARIAQLVEHQLPKLRVASSNLVSRSVRKQTRICKTKPFQPKGLFSNETIKKT